MTQIRLDNVGFGYADRLFSGVTLSISDFDKVGVVGNNGTGKTSLLKCVAGQLEPTEGRIIKPKSLRFGFIEQDVPPHLLNKTLHDVIAEAIPAHDRDANLWKVDVALDTFKAPQDIISRPICELSGGWQRLAMIARTGISDPDVLLLDEPTNHLDLEKIFVLENWLNEQIQGIPTICVSHDRRFLDNCTNKTLFVRSALSANYSHPYSVARQLLDQDDKTAYAQREKELKEISRLEKSAHELRQIGVNDHSDNALKKSAQIAKRAETIRSQTTEVYVEGKRDVRLSNSGTHAKYMVQLENVDVSTPDGKHLFHIEKLSIGQNDRLILLGVNGAGKSQFVQALRRAFEDKETAKQSGIAIGPSIQLGYIDQLLSQLPLNKGMRDFIAEQGAITPQRITGVLVEAGFPYQAQDKKIKLLSYGERSRLSLLALRLAEPNFYIMDEPTNHLDVSGQEQLEREILNHGASCVLVSHDRSFVSNLGTRFCVIHEGKLREIDSPEIFYEYMLNGTPMFASGNAKKKGNAPKITPR